MGNELKKIVILGSTGSVGKQTLDIVRQFPEDFEVVGLSAGNNLDLLQQQMHEFNPKVVSCEKPDDFLNRNLLKVSELVSHEEVASCPEADIVVAASVGKAGLAPIITAINSGKNIALANKESIVMAGELVVSLAKARGVEILPVDSEPSAIWQCIRGEDKNLSKIIITASGGALKNVPLSQLNKVIPEQALKHPTWQMGKKITIDSATLMNKGFEVIESKWLFDLDWNQIEVVVHPQSIIHSLVEFRDRSVKAQLSPPDMRLPIQYAMFYPDRVKNELIEQFDPIKTGSLTFEPLDHQRYPCFEIALEAASNGGTYTSVLNASDEVAVEKFLKGLIRFTDIPMLIESVLSKHSKIPNPTIEDIIMADEWARIIAHEWRQ